MFLYKRFSINVIWTVVLIALFFTAMVGTSLTIKNMGTSSNLRIMKMPMGNVLRSNDALLNDT